MWYLTSEVDHRVIYILPNKEVTIGRNVDHFAIPDDASISRKHATLSSTSNGLYLQDLGSRYGTYVNNSCEKIDNNSLIKLQRKDVVKFGKLDNKWQVNEVNFITCTSTLKGEHLQTLKLCVSKVGGIIKSEWDDSCMYLTMPALTLTIKVVLALVQGSLIVTTEYWNKCLEAINANTSMPNPNNFSPQIVESTLNKDIVSFLPNDSRKILFDGKKIVFFSRKQFEMYKLVLIKSAGTPLLLSDSKMTKSMLCEQDVIVIQCNPTSTEVKMLNDVIDYLNSKGKRVIADAEIGLAILYCSIEKYCNPCFNFSSEIIKQKSNEIQQPAKVLALESQELNKTETKKEHVVINESLTSENYHGNFSKRRLSIDGDENYGNASKKLATESGTIENSNKRKNCGDINGQDINPHKKLATTKVDNKDDDLFNFIAPANKSPPKKLNLLKAVKRKQDMRDDNEDELFQFIEEKKPSHGNISNNSIFKTSHKHSNSDDEADLDTPIKKISMIYDDVDISALRGCKLEELRKNNMNSTSTINIRKLKQEITDDLDEKMSNLDIGSIIVTIKKELIVKKEPHIVELHNSSVKNFKKFQKVWPLKNQSTIILAL
ncbi:nibrin [Achroia grisella]|uniref:nibrin n=1 Tax=Achroia grisella TaxID=688607 RepID=UPI0027D33357|nr:nibrin [Achroia grisella]